MWVNQLKRWLDKLGRFDGDDHQHEVIQFPASLTPLSTYTQVLLEQHPHRLSAETKSILSQDFATHSIEFVFNLDRFVSKMSSDHGIKIIIHNGPSVNFNILPVDKNKIFVPRMTVNKEVVFAYLMAEKRKRSSHNKNNSYKSDKSINENIVDTLNDDLISDTSSVSDDNDKKETSNKNEGHEDKDKTLSEDELEMSECAVRGSSLKDTSDSKVYTLNVVSTKYWQCQILLKQLRISNEEFEAKAMELFPASFVWLLRECARMINVSIRDLYGGVLLVEKLCENFDERKGSFKYKK